VENLGPASQSDLHAVTQWIEKYKIYKYIGSGYESELAGIDDNLIWTEYMSGLEGDYTCNGYRPPAGDWVPQGYFIAKKARTGPEQDIFIWTFASEPCGCDGEDEDCEECEGEGSIDADLVSIASNDIR
jgi:hypothetical protein